MFSLEKKRLRRCTIIMYQYTKGGYQVNRDSLFTRTHREKTRSKRDRLLLRRTLRHWTNSLHWAVLRQAAEPSHLKYIWAGKVEPDDPWGPVQPTIL